MKIACIIQVYNELDSGHLQEFFKYALPLFDNIIVYDDASSDGSKEYCKKYTEHIISGKKNCFSDEVAHKKELLAYADSLDIDYIVSLDADEILCLTKGSLAALCEEMNVNGVDGIKINFINLWRSRTWKRVDSLFDEYAPIKIWKHISGQDPFPQDKGTLHQTLHPDYIKNISTRNDISILHTGFSTLERIVRKFIIYQNYGQTGFNLTRFIDESSLEVEHVREDCFPEAYLVDEVKPSALGVKEYVKSINNSRPEILRPKFSVICLIYKDTRWLEFVYKQVLKYTDMSNKEFFFVANEPNEEVKNYLTDRYIPHHIFTPSESESKEHYINNVYRAYNYGVTKARGEFVILINSDMAFTPSWVENLYNKFDGFNCVASRLVEQGKLTPGQYGIAKNFGNTFEDYKEDNFLNYAEQLATDELHDDGLYMPALIKKTHFELVGGYPEGNIIKGSNVFSPEIALPGQELISGDTAFMEKLKTKGIFHKTSFNSIAYHFQEGEKRSLEHLEESAGNAPKIGICNDILTGTMGEKVLWDRLLELPNTEGIDYKKAKGKSFSHFDNYILKNELNIDIIIQNATFLDFLGNDRFSIVFLQDDLRRMEASSYVQEKNLKNANMRVTNSLLTASSYPEYSFTIIPVGIDHQLFLPMDNESLKQKWHIPNDKKIGIFVGALDEVKGWSRIQECIEGNEDIFWIIVSKYPVEYSHPMVKLFIRVPQEELTELLNCSDFFILGSKVETQCLAALEAALCNIPIIMDKTGIFDEWPDDDLEKIGIFDRPFKQAVLEIEKANFSPRKTVLKYPITVESSMDKWIDLMRSARMQVDGLHVSNSSGLSFVKKPSVLENYFYRVEFFIRKNIFQRIFKRDQFFTLAEISVYLNRKLPSFIFIGIRAIWRIKTMFRKIG